MCCARLDDSEARVQDLLAAKLELQCQLDQQSYSAASEKANLRAEAVAAKTLLGHQAHKAQQLSGSLDQMEAMRKDMASLRAEAGPLEP